MKITTKAVFLNLTCVIAAVAAIFFVPPQTQVKSFVALCLSIILVVNITFFGAMRLANRSDTSPQAQSQKPQYRFYLVMAFIWMSLLISSPWGWVVVEVSIAAGIVTALAIWFGNWIAKRSAGPK